MITGISSLTISNAGTGYTVGDTIVLGDAAARTNPQIRVTAVNASGGITKYSVWNDGEYVNVDPTGRSLLPAGGHGTGLVCTVGAKQDGTSMAMRSARLYRGSRR